MVSPPEGRAASAAFWREHLRHIEKSEEHVKLKRALAKYIWDRGGVQYNATRCREDEQAEMLE
jgi:ribosomal protein L31E